jgi:putative transposase
MPWSRVTTMDQRSEFVAAHSSGLYSVTELCNRFGISRKTGYKWIKRNEEQGAPGLLDASRARQSQLRKTSESVVASIVAFREKHPKWGARKLLVSMATKKLLSADLAPSASTVTRILKEAGLVTARRRRSKPPHPGACPLVADEPNQVWSIDYKGQFQLADGTMSYPLTVQDAATRQLILCRHMPAISWIEAKKAMTDVFKTCGLPIAIRSDNGSPFCSNAVAGVSQLSKWWMRLGIRHDRIRPSSPQENGRHERMHRTLKAETTRPMASNGKAQQERFDVFVEEYNNERPHEAIEYKVPGALWHPSPTQFPEELPEFTYPPHMVARRVRSAGEIKFQGQLIFISEVLIKEWVALEETEEDIWAIYFGTLLLGKIDPKTKKLINGSPKGKKRSTKPAAAQIGASQ